MRPENQKMQKFLKENGIDAVPKYIKDGSLKGTWRIYGLTGEKTPQGYPVHQKWWGNKELQQKFTDLGFTDWQGKPVSDSTGNGGDFSVFVRGHNEFLK